MDIDRRRLARNAFALPALPILAGAAPLAKARLANAPPPEHRVAIQVNSDDQHVMLEALAAVANLTAAYAKNEQPVRIEIVANGRGLAMLRSDLSPIAPPLEQFSERYKLLTYSACGATIDIATNREDKPIPLFPFARTVPSGVGRLVELQEQGWAYLKP